MTDNIDDQEEEDPRIVAIYRRMRVIVGVSVLIMGVGFAAVIGVIMYRLLSRPEPLAGPTAPISAALALRTLPVPAGARVVSTAVDGGRLFVTVESEGRTRVHLFNAADLSEIGRLDVVPEGAPR